ncbi:MAG TPA: response regulator transcription factor, partial [Mycobacterium sp.]
GLLSSRHQVQKVKSRRAATINAVVTEAVAVAPETKDLTVVLAHDQSPARAGIRRAIEPHGLRVVGESASASEALRMALALRPEVCVLAVELPGNGIEAARAIKQALPATKIVMMTASPSEEDLFGALGAGADGYLLMSTSASRLAPALRGVANGEAALPRWMTARLIQEFRERGTRHRVNLPDGAGQAELTAREFEVLKRLRRRERTADIAARLGISEVTVRRHVSSVLRKLGMPNRRAAVETLEQAEREEQRAGELPE